MSHMVYQSELICMRLREIVGKPVQPFVWSGKRGEPNGGDRENHLSFHDWSNFYGADTNGEEELYPLCQTVNNM